MADQDDRVYVGHMLDMVRRARKALQNKSRADYDADDILRLGLTHIVQVIGMRHRIFHDYMRVDEDVLWEVVSKDLPTLLPLLRKIDVED